MRNIQRFPFLLFFFAFAISSANAQPSFKKLEITDLSFQPHTKLQNLHLRADAFLPESNSAVIASSCFVVGVNCTVLPVKLLDFSAIRLNDQTANVTWTTALESDILGYYIERALPPGTDFLSREFMPVKVVPGNKNEYKYADPNNLFVTSYYRLRIAHADGSFTFSDIKRVPPVKRKIRLKFTRALPLIFLIFV